MNLVFQSGLDLNVESQTWGFSRIPARNLHAPRQALICTTHALPAADWHEQLVVCWLPACRQAWCGHHESDPECQAQRARSVCLLERCPDSPANPSQQHDWRVVATSLADTNAIRLSANHSRWDAVNMSSPRPYVKRGQCYNHLRHIPVGRCQ